MNEHLNGNLIHQRFSFDERIFPELKDLPDNLDTYEKLHEFSLNNYEQFWSVIARKRLQWYQEFNQVTNLRSFHCEDFYLKWFDGGKLNASGLCF